MAMSPKSQKVLRIILEVGFFLIFAILPLVVTNKFFFPFMFPKAVLFRVLVEILFVVYLVLAAGNPAFRLRIRPLVGLYGLWVTYTLVSSAMFGENFYLSFWGDMERSEGILLHLHLFAFLVLLSATVQTKADWARVLQYSVGGAFLMGLYAVGQELGLEFVINTEGSRASSTIGNAGFFAAILIFNIFFCLYLLLGSKAIWQRIGYAGLAVFFGWIVYASETRGAVLALLLTLVLSGFFIIGRRGNRKLKVGYVIILVGVLAGSALLVSQASSGWVQRSATLRRMASISSSERTVQTRLMAWEISAKGWGDNFVFGNGLENFNLVFNKYFNPDFYQDEGSRVWFDRAHNIFFDRAVAGGVLGLFIYLSIFGYAFYLLIFKLWRNAETRTLAAVFCLLLVAYLVQNLFIFDIVLTYTLLMLVLAFLDRAAVESQPTLVAPAARSARMYQIAAAVAVVLLIPIMYGTAIRPALASRYVGIAFGIQADIPLVETEEKRAEFYRAAGNYFEKALALDTYGSPEFRIHFAQYVDGLIVNNVPERLLIQQAVSKINTQLERQLAEDPKNVASYLLAMRHYNIAYEFGFDYSERVIALLEPAVALSPNRAHLHTEAGYAWVHLIHAAKDNKDQVKLDEAKIQAEIQMQKALVLNPRVVESYINLILVYLSVGDLPKVEEVFQMMEQQSVNYHTFPHLRKLASTAVGYQQYELANRFLLEANQLRPDDLRTIIDLALSYAYIGQDTKAIELAESLKILGPDYVTEAETFIKDVKAGNYRRR